MLPWKRHNVCSTTGQAAKTLQCKDKVIWSYKGSALSNLLCCTIHQKPVGALPAPFPAGTFQPAAMQRPALHGSGPTPHPVTEGLRDPRWEGGSFRLTGRRKNGSNAQFGSPGAASGCAERGGGALPQLPHSARATPTSPPPRPSPASRTARCPALPLPPPARTWGAGPRLRHRSVSRSRAPHLRRRAPPGSPRRAALRWGEAPRRPLAAAAAAALRPAPPGAKRYHSPLTLGGGGEIPPHTPPQRGREPPSSAHARSPCGGDGPGGAGGRPRPEWRR